jgi:hypothetical protein
MANMTNEIGTFFWLSFIFMFIKYKIDLPIFGSTLFVVIVMIFMYFINMSILQQHCGNVDSMILLKSTLLPWIIIFANVMFVLSKAPSWLTPFSNTFGLLVARFVGCNTAFLEMLNPQEKTNNMLHYVFSDPSLLVNRFTMINFDATIDTLSHIIDKNNTAKIADFKQFVKLKEIVSEWIWYMLTASITISVSYNSIISSRCNKTTAQYTDSHNNAMAETTPEVTPSVYTIT